MDGTTNFIHRLRHSAVSLALISDGQPLLGIVFNPDSDECFTAIAGCGAKLNGHEICVSRTETLV